MKTKQLLKATLLTAALLPIEAMATRLMDVKVIDKDYVMLHFRDGEVRYRDDATGPSAYLGHSFAEGDDTLRVYGQRLDALVAKDATLWGITSADDRSYGEQHAREAWRKSKPMNTDHTLTSELDHWIFLHLPQPMRQGCTYSISIPQATGTDVTTAEVKYDIWTSQSEAIHVNVLGYTPTEPKAADLYLWLGDGGQRDYKAYEGKKVYLYNVDSGKKRAVGKVAYWKPATDATLEANKKNMTGSDVWNVDFACTTPGRYRLVVEDVGCSMDFDIKDDLYREPFAYSVRGYYYMRLGEPIDTPRVTPVPRQPRFIPEVDPVGFTVYKTDLQPWHPDWRKLRGDVWDEPHFKPALESAATTEAPSRILDKRHSTARRHGRQATAATPASCWSAATLTGIRQDGLSKSHSSTSATCG